jgi:electron-transferring-flavoprotein dehydrogenase
MQREVIEYDVIIVGAGPAGLATAIRLKQLQASCRVAIVEKSAEIGGHILSGAVIDPSSLLQLLPSLDLRSIATTVTRDKFLFLTAGHSLTLPTPKPMRNTGNYIISLGALCRCLASQAEQLGVDIFPGFAAVDTLIEDQKVCGIITGDLGVDPTGKPLSNYQAGIEIRATHTVLAEGARGSLTEPLLKHFNARQTPQTYALGVKECWHVENAAHQSGLVLHSVGWPLDRHTYGGSFLYHLNDHKLAVGFVVGLDYQNPTLDPFAELQRFKTHPKIRHYFTGGERISYGARALNEGGFQSIPQLSVPGAILVGCSAGFLNVAKLKGIHNAIHSGMLAAAAICESEVPTETYQQKIKASPLWQELYCVRNLRPAFRWGLLPGLCYAAIDTYLFQGRAPWTFTHHADHTRLKAANKSKKITYPEPDNTLTFDKLSSVYLSNIAHPEQQPCHLKLGDPQLPIRVNYQHYQAPETRYCPAQVYEIVHTERQPQLRINAQNCIHCKTCDIKDPRQNITWHPPQGGSGPNYVDL